MKESLSTPSLEPALRELTDAIVRNNEAVFSELMDRLPSLAGMSFSQGATRQGPGLKTYFFEEIGQYIYCGDTALHFAAAAYRYQMIEKLVKAGSRVRAKNRRGTEPLHAAASGSPGSAMWDPAAQAATITCLIEAGADPNACNMDGATPLHRAVRTRCARAVQTLLEHGADPAIRNRNGSTAPQLVLHKTGRSGSGSPEANAQEQEILRLFQGR